MKTYWRAAAAVTALTAALTLGALLPATPGHTQVARTVVRVQQLGPNDAVPVTLQGTGAIAGSVNVANTPNVNVVNAPNVNVASLPAVQVNSSAVSPLFTRGVDDGANDIYHQTHAKSLFNNSEFNFASFAVPAGKRLIIETITVRATVPPGQKAEFVLLTIGSEGSTTNDPLTVQSQGVTEAVGGQERLSGTHPVRIRVDGTGQPSDITVSMTRNPAAGLAFLLASISGYLVDR